jgi:hypothetical protein
MRKKWAVFLTAAVFLSGVSLWLTMGTASAIKAPKTFTVTEKDSQFHFIDNPPMHRPNLGDGFAVSGGLRRNGNNVGTADIVCTITHMEPQRAECVATFTFKNQGEIDIQTSFSNTRHFKVGITGGTGNFQNARGYLEIQQKKNNVSTDTFHLLP